MKNYSRYIPGLLLFITLNVAAMESPIRDQINYYVTQFEPVAMNISNESVILNIMLDLNGLIEKILVGKLEGKFADISNDQINKLRDKRDFVKDSYEFVKARRIQRELRQLEKEKKEEKPARASVIGERKPATIMESIMESMSPATRLASEFSLEELVNKWMEKPEDEIINKAIDLKKHDLAYSMVHYLGTDIFSMAHARDPKRTQKLKTLQNELYAAQENGLLSQVIDIANKRIPQLVNQSTIFSHIAQLIKQSEENDKEWQEAKRLIKTIKE